MLNENNRGNERSGEKQWQPKPGRAKPVFHFKLERKHAVIESEKGKMKAVIGRLRPDQRPVIVADSVVRFVAPDALISSCTIDSEMSPLVGNTIWR